MTTVSKHIHAILQGTVINFKYVTIESLITSIPLSL